MSTTKARKTTRLPRRRLASSPAPVQLDPIYGYFEVRCPVTGWVVAEVEVQTTTFESWAQDCRNPEVTPQLASASSFYGGWRIAARPAPVDPEEDPKEEAERVASDDRLVIANVIFRAPPVTAIEAGEPSEN